MTAWLPLRAAATILSVTPDALRKQFERRAQKAPDGVVEARIDGVHARKFGGRWRVALGPQWSQPDVIRSPSQSREERDRGDRP